MVIYYQNGHHDVCEKVDGGFVYEDDEKKKYFITDKEMNNLEVGKELYLLVERVYDPVYRCWSDIEDYALIDTIVTRIER